ncbi:MAG: hypothetical protein MK212_18620 [Saprospiraceae bacterium]|nr:hypothetical protein [Saprospiraceae bacterium]
MRDNIFTGLHYRVTEYFTEVVKKILTMNRIYLVLLICFCQAWGAKAQNPTPRIEYFQSPHTFGFAGQDQNTNTNNENRLNEGFRKNDIEVKNIKEEEGWDDAIIVFPHPLGKNLIVKILDPDKGMVNIEIYADGGNTLMLTARIDAIQEPTKIWDLEELPKGEYLLFIRGLEDDFESVYTLYKH